MWTPLKGILECDLGLKLIAFINFNLMIVLIKDYLCDLIVRDVCTVDLYAYIVTTDFGRYEPIEQ